MSFKRISTVFQTKNFLSSCFYIIFILSTNLNCKAMEVLTEEQLLKHGEATDSPRDQQRLQLSGKHSSNYYALDQNSHDNGYIINLEDRDTQLQRDYYNSGKSSTNTTPRGKSSKSTIKFPSGLDLSDSSSGSDTSTEDESSMYFMDDNSNRSTLRERSRHKSSSQQSFLELTQTQCQEKSKPVPIWNPVSYSVELLKDYPNNEMTLEAMMMEEIDRDFFAKFEDFSIKDKSCAKMIMPYLRASLATVAGIFISSSISSLFIIDVGDWYGAYKDTTAAAVLVSYIATMSILVFANQWDNRIKSICNFLWPARYIFFRTVDKKVEEEPSPASNCSLPTVDREVETKAVSKSLRFESTSAPVDYYILSSGILLISSAAYAIVPLRELLNSNAAKYYPRYTWFSGTLYFFTLADIFYQTVSLSPNLRTDEAYRKMHILMDHVRLFKENISDNKETAKDAYDFLKDHLNRKSQLRDNYDNIEEKEKAFLFSALFLVPDDPNILKHLRKRVSVYNQLVENRYNPSDIARRNSLINTTNMSLGIGWLYLAMLLAEEYDITLMQMQVPKDASYWTALGGGIFQAMNFVYSTYDIQHSYTQQLMDMGTTVWNCFSYEWVSNKYKEIKEELTFTSAVKSSVSWFLGKAKETASFTTGGLIASPMLKRALDIYSNLTSGMRYLQSLPPYIMQSLFLTRFFSKNLDEIKGKFFTSHFYTFAKKRLCCLCNESCDEGQMLETLDLFADSAIDQLRKFNDKTIFMLYHCVLERPEGKKGMKVKSKQSESEMLL